MTFRFKRPLIAALMLSAAAPPALAELSVDDAWNSWLAQFKAMGLTLSAGETREGSALQIGPVSVSVELPMGLGRMSAGFDGPRFEPGDDGAVQMTLPESGIVSIAAEFPEQRSFSMDMEFDLTGHEAIMSGTPDRVVSETSYGAVELDVLRLSIDGEVLENASGEMVMYSGTYRNVTTIGEMVTLEGGGQYEDYAAGYAIEFDEGGTSSHVSYSQGADRAVYRHTATMLAQGGSLMSMARHLRNGLSISASAQVEGERSQEAQFIDGALLYLQATDVADYNVSMTVDRSGAALATEAGAFKADVQVTSLPTPVSVTGKSASWHFSMPLLTDEAAQQAGLRVELQDLSLNEDIWALFDAGGELPRDPMALRLDLAGEVALTTDLVDFAAMAALDEGAMPLLPVTADLKSLLLSAAGAEVAGHGAFTFDASDTQTFPGLPRPEGSLDLRLLGVHALLDRLVEIGLVPEEQAMGTRMMMGMFAVPDGDEDALRSQIEINTEGHVLANGQRLN